MNATILSANILTLLAFIIYAFIGEWELKIVQPSIGFAGRSYHTKMPDSFKQKDDKWWEYTFESALHFGLNF